MVPSFARFSHLIRLTASCRMILRGVHQQALSNRPSPSSCLLNNSLRASQGRQLLMPCVSALIPERGMKVKSSIKKRCKHCRVEKRMGRWHVICEDRPRHNQRQLGRLPPPELEYFPYYFRKQDAK